VSDVAVGPDGSAWAIGTTAITNVGYQILEWHGTKFAQRTGAGVEIAVGPNDTPWVVNRSHEVFKWNGTSWGNPLPGSDGSTPASARDVAVGPDGSAWAISTTREEGGYQILAWDGSRFVSDKSGVGAVEIAVGASDTPWIVNSSHRVFERTGSGWGRPLPGSDGIPASVSDVAVGPDGSAWAIGTAPIGNTGYRILRWEKTKFAPWTGLGVEIAVGPGNTPWVVNGLNEVYQS
jgi:hypothetical protein